EPAGLRGLADPLRPAMVEEHDRARGVVVPDVVVDHLVVPLVLAGLRVDRDDRRGEEVLAGALAAVEVVRRVAGREVDRPGLGIDGRGLPDRRTAVLPDLRVCRPRVVT